MNDHKVAFIIATNDEQYFTECSYYINNLLIPEGYETDVIAVRDAKSICEAYNAAMHSSDAFYKVYLHQDVFILNTEFIKDIIDAFSFDPAVGLLGVIGAKTLPSDAYAFNSWDTGVAFTFNGTSGGIRSHVNEKGLNYVSAIDGMMMITNRDLEWREDIFDGWDFYDLSQSMEFWRAGYKVAVPYQKSPWCMHDMGFLGLDNYDCYRKKFCDAYHDDYGFNVVETIESPFKEEEERNLKLAKKAGKLICRDLEYSRFQEALNKYKFAKIFRAIKDNDLEIIRELLLICGEEVSNGENHFWKEKEKFSDVRAKLISLRFLLYRAEFDCPSEDYIPVLMEAFVKNRISIASVGVAVRKYIYNKNKVQKKIENIFDVNLR